MAVGVTIASKFLEGGGELGRLIAEYPWESSPLGRIPDWPQSLKTTLGLLLRSPVPIVLLWGEDGIMLYNDAYSGVAAGRHPRLLGSKLREGWPEVAAFNDHVMRIGLAGGTLSYKDQELTLYRNGKPEQVWMNLDYSPVLDESGRPAGVIAIVVETTERVLAERQVIAEREHLKQMFMQAPGFMAIQRGPEHVYEFVNDAYDKMAGGRPLLGKTIREAWPDLEGQPFFEQIDRVYRTGETYRGARAFARIAGPDGTMHDRYMDFVYQPLFKDGKVAGIFTEGYDVTEQAQVEAARAAMEGELRVEKARAEQSLLAKSKFIAAASHDLRQPVQSLVLFLSALKNVPPGQPIDRPVRYMEQAVEALNVMLNGLLDLSRLDAGILLPQVAPMPVGDLVRRIGDEYAMRANEIGLRLKAMPSEAWCVADAAFLERILRNLIENALRYTTAGGVVIGCRRRGPEIRIDVVDSGIGIDAHHLETIFEEYFQVGNEARDRSKGLGLGLAIVNRLTKLMGGRIEVASRFGHGSRFSISLLAAGAERCNYPASSETLSGEGLTAVVIDDEEMVRASLRMMLESWSFMVVDAGDGDEAIERLAAAKSQPRLILADYRLRMGRTGLAAAHQVIHWAGRQVPTAIVTGDTAPERIQEVHSSGFLMLHKPVASDELRSAVGYLLRSGHV